MALASLDGDSKITIRAQIYERDVLAQLPGASWDRNRRVWKAPLAWSTCLVLRGQFGDSLEIDEALR